MEALRMEHRFNYRCHEELISKITLFSSLNKDTYLFRMVSFNSLNKTQLRVKPIRVCVITCCVRRIKFA